MRNRLNLKGATAGTIAVAAFAVLQRSEFPSGGEELPADEAGLREVTIQAAESP